MKKPDILSILMTFIFGAIAGFYLYMTVYAPFSATLDTPDSEQLSEFIIEGRIYGSCSPNCPSFQVLGNGSYRYLFTFEPGQDQVLRQGTLSIKYQSGLRKALTTESLARQSKIIESAKCNSSDDGVDVSYEITIKGTKYKLDSCGTAVAGDSKLWLTLYELWDFFKTLGNN
ncbi:hypothetical protein KC865_02075 [Candidatus Kaiserbacteria bacterium]|nr:hypothetical protein [Candidatus Kaiserbacteria bacterium]USN92191.1 MAG: hypothetical protein H6782_04940 [Candidatus Nomurabacteria bacterium]